MLNMTNPFKPNTTSSTPANTYEMGAMGAMGAKPAQNGATSSQSKTTSASLAPSPAVSSAVASGGSLLAGTMMPASGSGGGSGSVASAAIAPLTRFSLSDPIGLTAPYDYVNRYFSAINPLIVVSVIVIGFVLFFVFTVPADLTSGEQVISPNSSAARSLSIFEIFFWAAIVFLVVINGFQYMFSTNIETQIRNIFTAPEIDLTVSQVVDKTKGVPEITVQKQVFHISDNIYTYDDAKALCKAYGGRLAKYEEIEKAYNEGAEWCGYGWSANQLVLFPTQPKTYDTLQRISGHENDCGRPGINGGYIANKNAKFGVNCYGYKPVMNSAEKAAMEHALPYPITEKDKELEKKVNKYRENLDKILVSPFNRKVWSLV